MITVKIAGGLGNQMFIAAYAKALQMRNNKVRLDVETFFHHDQNNIPKSKKLCIRELALEDFNITIPFEKPFPGICRRFFAPILKKIGLYHDYNWLSYKYSCVYMSDMLKLKDHSYVCGYFQNEKFFREYESEIRRMFRPRKEVKLPEKLRRERNKDIPIVSVHFRRTDYKYKWVRLCILENEYYERALSYLKEKIGKFDILVFSDDCDWVKRNIHLEKYRAFYANDYNKKKDYEEML